MKKFEKILSKQLVRQHGAWFLWIGSYQVFIYLEGKQDTSEADCRKKENSRILGKARGHQWGNLHGLDEKTSRLSLVWILSTQSCFYFISAFQFIRFIHHNDCASLLFLVSTPNTDTFVPPQKPAHLLWFKFDEL